MTALLTTLILAQGPFLQTGAWRWRADVPDQRDREAFGPDAVALVVRPVPDTWRLLPLAPDRRDPVARGVRRGAQTYEVLDASREGVPKRVALALLATPRTSEPRALLVDAPLGSGARYLAVVRHTRDLAWTPDAPDAPRALLSYDRDRLVRGGGAKTAFLASLAASLGRRRAAEAADAYAWLGEAFRAATEEGSGAGAYLADATRDPADRAAAGRFAAAAAKADPASRVYLAYLAATWGAKVGSDFGPFFDALRKAKGRPDLKPETLFSLSNGGSYPIMPAARAARLAFGFEDTPFFLFMFRFGFGPTEKEDLKRVYLRTKSMTESNRYSAYQIIASGLGFDAGLYRYYPEGAYPIWRFGHIDHEEGVREKFDAYFDIPHPAKP